MHQANLWIGPKPGFTKFDLRPHAARHYRDVEVRKGITNFEDLPKSYQMAVTLPLSDRLGVKNKETNTVKQIPIFERRLMNVMSVRSRAVYIMYMVHRRSAREIASRFGWDFLTPHDIYIIANKIRKLIKQHYDRNTAYDWDLAWMLAAEGATDDEIVEIIKCKPATYARKSLALGKRKKRTGGR